MDAKVLNEIRELTDINDNGSAYLLGAQLLGDNTLACKFERINHEHRRLGYLPPDLDYARHTAYKELMVVAKRQMSPDEYKKFYMLF